MCTHVGVLSHVLHVQVGQTRLEHFLVCNFVHYLAIFLETFAEEGLTNPHSFACIRQCRQLIDRVDPRSTGPELAIHRGETNECS